MPAYFLFDNVEVVDPECLARCAERAARTVADHNGRYLAVAPHPEIIEGRPVLHEPVLIEFPDLDAARAWYDSPEYQPLQKLRHRAARSTAVLFEGTDPPR
ncbi:MAG: DUF1330 domain-containing protein [Actinomycetota bacterium]|nr:DUF1330 domain-containing protein [Actinomycetota bacterium]